MVRSGPPNPSEAGPDAPWRLWPSLVKHPEIRVFDCHVARERHGQWEFLLLERAQGRTYAGDWRMVGGKIQPGEAAWQACIRELWEETQLSPQRLITLPYINRFYEWQHDRINDIPVFLAVTSGSEPTLDNEHVAAQWLTADQAMARLPWPGQIEGLRAALATLSNPSPLLTHLEIDPSLFGQAQGKPNQ